MPTTSDTYKYNTSLYFRQDSEILIERMMLVFSYLQKVFLGFLRSNEVKVLSILEICI